MKGFSMRSMMPYLIAVVLFLGGGYIVLTFPTGLVIQPFLPTITQSDLKEKPYEDVSGLNAGSDIFRLEAMSQYKDGTYKTTAFVTVETSVVIPLDVYRLKNTSDTHYSYGAGRNSKSLSLPLYTTSPSIRRDYLYGRYYLLGLSDGSYVVAYADQGYFFTSLINQKTTFPIGRLSWVDKKGKELIKQMSGQYSVDPEKVLYMINDRRISDLNFLDLVVRVGVVTVFAAIIGVLLWRRRTRKKQSKKATKM